MAFTVFAERSTGRLCAMLDPDLAHWPEARWARAERDDLHTHQGEITDVLAYRNGEIQDKTDADKLSDAQAAARIEIDHQAEALRLRIITPGSGQMETYRLKLIEAQQYKDDANPVPANYPHLQAELGITPHPATGQVATTLGEMADVIAFTAQIWVSLSPLIEHARRGAKWAVDQAQNIEAVQAVLDGLSWPALPAGV